MKRVLAFICLVTVLTCSPFGVFAYSNYFTLPSEWADYSAGDPFVLKYNGTYYLYVSTKDDQVGIKCWSSMDLVNWTYQGLCATQSLTQGAYAPEVVYWNGTFYMYISPGGGGHYILTSTSPTGPFTAVTGNLGHSIDGNVFIDDDGSWYFYHAGSDGIHGHTMGSPTSIGSDIVLAGTQISGQWTEGPTVIKRNGIYYLTDTGNHVHSTGYRVNLTTSSTGPLSGYTSTSNNPILINTEGQNVGLGHSSTFVGPDLDTYYMIYHNYLGRNSQTWPIRETNMDAIGWNGSKMIVYGPTDWSMPNPSLPVFDDRFNRTLIGSNWINVNGGNWGIYDSQLMYQDTTGNSDFFMEIANNTTGSDYTAEYNAKEVHRGSDDSISRFGAVFGYKDQNNYGIAVLSSYYNRLETNFLVNGVWSTPQYSSLPAGYDYQKWHNIRVEKSGSTYKFFVDGMNKQTRTSNLDVGKIGYLSCDNHSDFGYIAFSNKVNGSGIFDFYKPIPGTIQAVHYNSGGEGVGYHDITSGNTGGQYTRNDDVDIRNCPEGGHNIGWNTTGEWFKYNVNVKENGTYNVGLRYATTYTGSKVRIWFDSTDITGAVTLPSTGGWDNWQTYTMKGLNLTSGNHTIRIETVQGEFDVYTYSFYKADNSTFTKTDSFTFSFSGDWNWSGGNWAIEGGEASIDNVGKRTLGSTGWSDYTVETDIKCIDAINAGIIFRVTNPAQGGAGDDAGAGSDFYQGYFAGISSGGVVLGKQNYNWTQLASSSGTYTTNTWYHVKIVVSGNNFKVYVGDMSNPKIDYTDDNNPFINGKVGLRSHYSHTHFDNFTVIR